VSPVVGVWAEAGAKTLLTKSITAMMTDKTRVSFHGTSFGCPLLA